MSTQVIVSHAIDTGILDITRNALVEGVTKTGVVIDNYSLAIASVFDRKDINGNVIAKWFTLDGKEAKGIKAERKMFDNTLMDRDAKFIKSTDADGKRTPTGTVDTYWQRVKVASGYMPKGKPKGSNDVDAKTAAELKTMINRILGAEEAGQECHASTILDNLKNNYFVLTGEAYNANK
tara:strand:+ start:227 stop:763 length:537 start_codon:yes stop_codon:yes gene_type:complete